MKIMAELINKNFPKGFLYVVRGSVPETTEILSYPFDKIFFTGSPRVGKIVYEAAAKNPTPVILEFGGKTPLTISKSANIDVAVKRLIWGKFLNAGQTCIAPGYLLVDESIQTKVLGKLKEKLDEYNYTHESAHYASIINKRNFDRLRSLIDSEKIYYGGDTDEEHLHIGPTILKDVQWSDRLCRKKYSARYCRY